MRWIIGLALLSLTACDVEVIRGGPAPAAPKPAPAAAPPVSDITAEQAARSFIQVLDRVEPVAERECQRLTRGVNCDFLIVVDQRPGVPPNASQSLDATGRPVLTFTVPLILDARNADELAFVMGHEAAHHIAGHIPRQRQKAAAGAVALGGLATLFGGSASDVSTAQRLGAAVNARIYSKDFELEADRLGTVIAFRAGYDPLIGAQFFGRIPDPGDRFLGTHPPNAARYQAVVETMQTLR